MEKFRAAAAARKASGGGWGGDYIEFKVQKGEMEIVRFLEQGKALDDHWCFVHTMPPRGKQKYGDDVPCLDQEGAGAKRCPGCERGLDRFIEGFVPLIWRNGPIYGTKKLDDGREVKDWKTIAGKADVVAVWIVGQQRLEDIDATDIRYKGLCTRDFDITRNTLDGFETRYRFDPHMDEEGNAIPTPPSDADKKLAEDREDFRKMTQPPTYEEMLSLIQGGTAQSAQETAPPETEDFDFDAAQDTSPFEKKS